MVNKALYRLIGHLQNQHLLLNQFLIQLLWHKLFLCRKHEKYKQGEEKKKHSILGDDGVYNACPKT
jgi:hypothetical protein